LIPSTTRPYLSLVAVARNDDHGGNLLGRLQIFLNGVSAQANRHGLPIEFLLVEWNPPEDRPPLASALHWPHQTPTFQPRVVTVPQHLHQRYRFAKSLPLYQMAGKNVGIRRARGEFILATNIDILFSDELMRFLASQTLERDRLYRIDRHDVDSSVPVDASVEEQLSYCQTHRIRLNTIDGTFPLTSVGIVKTGLPDVVAAGSGISFGAGWSAPEQHFGQLLRWTTGDSPIQLLPSNDFRALQLELDCSAGRAALPFRLQAFSSEGAVMAEASIDSPRFLATLRIPPDCDGLYLHVQPDGPPAGVAPKHDLRLFGAAWVEPLEGDAPIAIQPARPASIARAWQVLKSGVNFLGDLRQRPDISYVSRRLAGLRPVEVKPAPLHTNACGDFTLTHRDHWFELRGYPEFDMYSMNIDSLFCFMAHYGGAAEQVLREPMRIYHIEHSGGSGWTPEGAQLLFDRLAAKGIPWMEYEEVLDWAAEMERLRTTIIFNRENWGLGDVDLPDATIRFSA
jgi:hypothetical protein